MKAVGRKSLLILVILGCVSIRPDLAIASSLDTCVDNQSLINFQNGFQAVISDGDKAMRNRTQASYDLVNADYLSLKVQLAKAANAWDMCRNLNQSALTSALRALQVITSNSGSAEVASIQLGEATSQAVVDGGIDPSTMGDQLSYQFDWDSAPKTNNEYWPTVTHAISVMNGMNPSGANFHGAKDLQICVFIAQIKPMCTRGFPNYSFNICTNHITGVLYQSEGAYYSPVIKTGNSFVGAKNSSICSNSKFPYLATVSAKFTGKTPIKQMSIYYQPIFTDPAKNVYVDFRVVVTH